MEIDEVLKSNDKKYDPFDPARRTEFEPGIRVSDMPSVAYFVSYGALEKIESRYKRKSCAFGDYDGAVRQVTERQLVTLLGENRLHILSPIDLEAALNSPMETPTLESSFGSEHTLYRYVVTRDEKRGKTQLRFAEMPFQVDSPLPYDVVSFTDLGTHAYSGNGDRLQNPGEISFKRPKSERVLDNLLGNSSDSFREAQSRDPEAHE